MGRQIRHTGAALRAPVDSQAVRDELLLGGAVLGLLVIVYGLSAAGGGSLARLLYIASGLLLAYVARRRSPWLLLSATLWFWLSAALVRRLVEYRSGYNSQDVVLLTPHLMTFVMVWDMVRQRGLLQRAGAGYALVLVACVLYGMFVSFMRGDIVPGLKSATDWLFPLFYLLHFICHADEIDTAEPHIKILLTLSLPFVVPYSLYQYFYMPEWDALWMVNSGMGSIGNPLPEGSRVFGPLNNPGFLAIWSGTCVVLMAHWRNFVLILLAPLLLFLVTLTLVRSVYGSVVLALIVGGLVIGRGRFPQLIAVFTVCGFIGAITATAVNPEVADKIFLRMTSVQKLSSDDSAQVRGIIIAQAPTLINDSPLGLGIGSQGRGNAGGGMLSSVNIDFGPLSVYLGLGWLVGTLYIGVLGLVVLKTVSMARVIGSDTAATMAAASIVSMGTFVFINVIGFSGVVFWTCVGWVFAEEIARQHALEATGGLLRASGGRRQPAH